MRQRPRTPAIQPEIRIITATGKDRHGAILSICHAGQPWSPRPKMRAVRDLDDGRCRYFVINRMGDRQRLVPVVRVNGATGPYLRTLADGMPHDNLAELPDGPTN